MKGECFIIYLLLYISFGTTTVILVSLAMSCFFDVLSSRASNKLIVGLFLLILSIPFAKVGEFAETELGYQVESEQLIEYENEDW